MTQQQPSPRHLLLLSSTLFPYVSLFVEAEVGGKRGSYYYSGGSSYGGTRSNGGRSSYGGSSSYGESGGYYRGYSNSGGYYNNDNDAEETYHAVGVVCMLFVVIVVLMGYHCVFCPNDNTDENTSTSSRNERIRRRVHHIRQREQWNNKIWYADNNVVLDAARDYGSAFVNLPFVFSGATFQANYTTDSSHSTAQIATGTMIFAPIPKPPPLLPPPPPSETTNLLLSSRQRQQSISRHQACRNITGRASDRNGVLCCNIIKGKLSPGSGKCYWVEESERLGQVLVRGTLAWGRESVYVTFSGQWEAENGEKGSFTRFDIVPAFDEMETCAEDQNPFAAAAVEADLLARPVVGGSSALHDNIPIAVAVPVVDDDESAVRVD